MPIDRLALTILQDLASTSSFWSWYNWNNDWRNASRSTAPVIEAFGEAWGWLHANGLVADNGLESKQFITRLGRAVLDRGVGHLNAVQIATRNIHGRIASVVAEQFLLGRYELAAFAAMREVEIRVRELAGASPSTIGVPLMRSAFNKEDGPLTDQESDGGERQGLSDLFAGAIATFKNPTSHRQVTFEDPVEAAEVIAFASLLLRILDRRGDPGD